MQERGPRRPRRRPLLTTTRQAAAFKTVYYDFRETAPAPPLLERPLRWGSAGQQARTRGDCSGCPFATTNLSLRTQRKRADQAPCTPGTGSGREPRPGPAPPHRSRRVSGSALPTQLLPGRGRRFGGSGRPALLPQLPGVSPFTQGGPFLRAFVAGPRGAALSEHRPACCARGLLLTLHPRASSPPGGSCDRPNKPTAKHWLQLTGAAKLCPLRVS